MNEGKRKIINKINNIEEMLYQNNHWIELLRGYCKSIMNDIEEFKILIQPLEKLLQNNQNLLNFSQDLNDSYFKILLESNENK